MTVLASTWEGVTVVTTVETRLAVDVVTVGSSVVVEKLVVSVVTVAVVTPLVGVAWTSVVVAPVKMTSVETPEASGVTVSVETTRPIVTTVVGIGG